MSSRQIYLVIFVDSAIEAYMKTAVIIFPGSNCDRDAIVALREIYGSEPHQVWHKETELPEGLDLVMLPGGFSYGDYLRAGAMAARSPIMCAVADHADAGGYVLGVCNGFQVLTETGLLPGALLRNAGLHFICRREKLEAINSDSVFTRNYSGEDIVIPIAHHDGNYVCDDDSYQALKSENRIAFKYAENPNGSRDDIAGILSKNGRVLGMMPHPERAIDKAHGGVDGRKLFEGLLAA